MILHKEREEAFGLSIFEAGKFSSRGWVGTHATLPFKPLRGLYLWLLGRDKTKSFAFWSLLTNSLYYAVALGN